MLVGLELHTEISLTGSLCLWFSVILSLGGFGLTLRALEARFGRLSLTEYQGLYQHSPALAVCFLLTGLACVGFPGTLGFISTELLVDSAVEVSPYVGIAVVTAAALNGIAVVRAYLLIFTGARHHSTVSLGIGDRERFAVLTFSALILGGGFFPQPGVSTRHRAAAPILAERQQAAVGAGGVCPGFAGAAEPAGPGVRPGPARRHDPIAAHGHCERTTRGSSTAGTRRGAIILASTLAPCAGRPTRGPLHCQCPELLIRAKAELTYPSTAYTWFAASSLPGNPGLTGQGRVAGQLCDRSSIP